jgi:hypothetical protein
MTVKEFLEKDYPRKGRESLLFILKGDAGYGIGPLLVVEETYSRNFLVPGEAAAYKKEELIKMLLKKFSFKVDTVYLLNSILEEFEEEMV